MAHDLCELWTKLFTYTGIFKNHLLIVWEKYFHLSSQSHEYAIYTRYKDLKYITMLKRKQNINVKNIKTIIRTYKNYNYLANCSLKCKIIANNFYETVINCNLQDNYSFCTF